MIWYAFNPFINAYAGVVGCLHLAVVVYNILNEEFSMSWPLIISTAIVGVGCFTLAIKKNLKTSTLCHRGLGLFLMMQLGNIAARAMRYSRKFTLNTLKQDVFVLVGSIIAVVALIHIFLWQRSYVKNSDEESFSPELGKWRLIVFQVGMHALGILVYTCAIGRLNYGKIPCRFCNDAILNLIIFPNIFAQTYFKKFRQSFRGTVINLCLTGLTMFLLTSCVVMYTYFADTRAKHGQTAMSLFFFIVAITACILTMFYKAAILEEPVFFSRTKTNVIMVKSASTFEGKEVRHLESRTTLNDCDNAENQLQTVV